MRTRFFFLILISLFFSREYAAASESCAIANGPDATLAEYRRSITTELASITQNAGNASCQNGASQSASQVSGVAWSQIAIFDTTTEDFAYQIQVVGQGKSRSRVIEDGKIFGIIDTEINTAIKNLANRCALNDTNRAQLQTLIIENQALQSNFKRTVLGNPPVTMTAVREQNRRVWDAIQNSYNPAATNGCEPVNKALANSGAGILNSITDIGGKTERALDAWKKAIALFQGGGKGMSPSEYSARQRKLLEAELARQGLSQNSKAVILGNFDCFKSEIGDPTQVEDVLSARIRCLSNPVTGIDRIFQGWRAVVLPPA